MSGRNEPAPQATEGSRIAPASSESDRATLECLANTSAPSRDAMLALYL